MHKLWRLSLIAMLLGALSGCAPTPPSAVSADSNQLSATDSGRATGNEADLSGIKEYLLTQTIKLENATSELKGLADQYYQLAQSVDFNYARLWNEEQAEVIGTMEKARSAWMAASPLYEKMEGIVAGTPSLSEFDIILDAGTSSAEGGENVVPFDLTLPNGQVVEKPGNLFGVSESTLWGTAPEFTVEEIAADFNGNGSIEFGESLPEANVFVAATEALNRYAADLHTASESWSPTVTDAFSALVTMIPTMNEYFSSWQASRFVAGESSTQRDFVAISRLADIQDILSGLQVVYQNVQPLIAEVDRSQSEQIAAELRSLNEFVSGVYAQEQSGKRFSAEEAELLGAEAQNRATAVTGQISQVAGVLGVELQ